MNTAYVRQLARRYPVTVFVVLAFVITWSVWVPRALLSDGLFDTLGLFWTFGPAVAAVLAAALHSGRTGLRELGSRLIRWRVSWRWYAVVLLGPAAFWALVLALFAGLGRSAELSEPLMIKEGALAVVPLLLVIALTDGVGEETGWRGFALPRQLEHFAALPASLLLGVIWAVWHLPLFWTNGATLAGASFWLLLIELPAMSVLYTWVFLNTNRSALLAVLFHAAWNVCTLSAAVAGYMGAAVVIILLKWLLAAAVAVSWSRRGLAQR